eukprot:4059863-Amphidinium_carterae.1
MQYGMKFNTLLHPAMLQILALSKYFNQRARAQLKNFKQGLTKRMVGELMSVATAVEGAGNS